MDGTLVILLSTPTPRQEGAFQKLETNIGSSTSARQQSISWSNKMKVGVCGTGRMGASITQRLIAVEHEVGVWNRDTTKTKPLTDAGAKLYASPAELARGCEAVIVMLLNDDATEAVYRSPNGLLNAELAGSSSST
jgi:lactate dehydrogenase-like 2-hydroxyacid dehydrogenase